MDEEQLHDKPSFDNMFFVLPYNDEKKIAIVPRTPGSTLKMGMKETEMLIQILQNQIQEWK